MPARVLRLVNALTLVRIPLAGVLWLRPHDLIFLVAVMAMAALSVLLVVRRALTTRAPSPAAR